MSTKGYKYSFPVNHGYTYNVVIEYRNDPSDLSSNGPDSSACIHRNPMAKVPQTRNDDLRKLE